MDNMRTSDSEQANEQASSPESVEAPGEDLPFDSEEKKGKIRKVNLGVRYYNYRGFMNRVKDDNWDHTIEALLTTNLRDAIDRERERRRRTESRANFQLIEAESDSPLIAQDSSKIGPMHRLFRVRIRSREILRHLGELCGWGNDIIATADGELVFCYPFATFGFCHDAMKQRLRTMESDQHRNSLELDSWKNSNIPALDEFAEKEDKSPAPITPLDELRCYITFVEQKILPLRAQCLESDKNNGKKLVCHEELALLFRPGELVYVPTSSESIKVDQQSAIQKVWRMYFCAPSDIIYKHDGTKWEDPNDGTDLDLYCLDHDGDSLRASWKNLRIDFFVGEKEITSLKCYPLKFHPRGDEILKQHIERGKTFCKIVQAEANLFYYSGWNLVTGICENKEAPIQVVEPEHLESDVIIDIGEAERHLTDFATRDVPGINTDWRFAVEPSALKYMIWGWQGQHGSNADPSSCTKIVQYDLYREDMIYSKEAAIFNQKIPAIDKDGKLVKDLAGEDFALFPRRVNGYVLRERKFAHLDVHNFKHKKEGENITLDDIQMKEDYRKVIRSSVTTHFRRAAQSKIANPETHNPDIIRGKGRGLVILLHGAPGVGKTATAEAVAMEFKKPLFPITCGDLGVTPKDVEGNLQKIFRYANLWDCVLLLDEADVFLTQRDRMNVERNALVSVFLRILEYYSGVLFLTTNRVGSLDEAFRSRVHISLYYPFLSFEDTIKILRQNLNRLPRANAQPDHVTLTNEHIRIMENEIIKFMGDEYREYAKDHGRGPWNGRQIRNAVQIAACLALFDDRDGPGNSPSVLTAQHFRTVHQTVTEFDQYMTRTQRGDDVKMAEISGDRIDYDAPGDARHTRSAPYQAYTGFGNDPRQDRASSCGHQTTRGPTRSGAKPREGWPAQDYGPNQNSSPSRVGYSNPPPHGTSRGNPAYRYSSGYSHMPMGEEENPIYQRRSDRQINLTDSSSENRHAPPHTSHGAMHANYTTEEQFHDDP